MLERLRVHADRPQQRLIQRAAESVRQGRPVVVPTEATYAIMCLSEAADAQAQVRRLRQLDDTHLWTLVCADLSQASRYVHLDNHNFRLLKRYLPGPYTFILPALRSLPRRIFGKRRDIGIRVPEHTVCHLLIEAVGAPLLSTTLHFPDEAYPESDPDRFVERLKSLDMVVIDAGWGGVEPTTVVDLCGGEVKCLREGLGAWREGGG